MGEGGGSEGERREGGRIELMQGLNKTKEVKVEGFRFASQ